MTEKILPKKLKYYICLEKFEDPLMSVGFSLTEDDKYICWFNKYGQYARGTLEVDLPWALYKRVTKEEFVLQF